MPRHLIESEAGEQRVVGDSALPYFPDWRVRDDVTLPEPNPQPRGLPDWWLALKHAAETTKD